MELDCSQILKEIDNLINELDKFQKVERTVKPTDRGLILGSNIGEHHVLSIVGEITKIQSDCFPMIVTVKQELANITLAVDEPTRSIFENHLKIGDVIKVVAELVHNTNYAPTCYEPRVKAFLGIWKNDHWEKLDNAFVQELSPTDNQTKSKEEEKPKEKPDKVKALADHIVAECKKQGFTVREFEDLYLQIQLILSDRQYETYKELF